LVALLRQGVEPDVTSIARSPPVSRTSAPPSLVTIVTFTESPATMRVPGTASETVAVVVVVVVVTVVIVMVIDATIVQPTLVHEVPVPVVTMVDAV